MTNANLRNIIHWSTSSTESKQNQISQNRILDLISLQEVQKHNTGQKVNGTKNKRNWTLVYHYITCNYFNYVSLRRSSVTVYTRSVHCMETYVLDVIICGHIFPDTQWRRHVIRCKKPSCRAVVLNREPLDSLREEFLFVGRKFVPGRNWGGKFWMKVP